MAHYANDENSNIKIFFSILTFDWCEPRQQKCKYSYFLYEKFVAFSKSGKNMLLKLCKIIEDDEKIEFHYVCLRIIYYMLMEIHDNSHDDNEIYSVDKNIEAILKMRNDEYKIEILKILFVFWNYNDIMN